MLSLSLSFFFSGLAKTDKIKPSHEKFAQDETTLSEVDKASFPDVVSRKQPQTLVSIQTLSLNYHAQRKVAGISKPHKFSKNVHWSIPETATNSIFLPSFNPISRRVFGKETRQMEKSRKPKEEPSEMKTTSDDMLKNILILSSKFSKPLNAPSLVTIPEVKEVQPKYYMTYTFKHPFTDFSATMPRPLPKTIPVHAQKHLQPSDHLQRTTAVTNIDPFLDIVLPVPVLPRKPYRQSEIGMSILNLICKNGVREKERERHTNKWCPLLEFAKWNGWIALCPYI